jgi:hypothetical protein
MKPLELASPGRTGAVKRRLISYAPGAGVIEALPLVLRIVFEAKPPPRPFLE